MGQKTFIGIANYDKNLSSTNEIPVYEKDTESYNLSHEVGDKKVKSCCNLGIYSQNSQWETIHYAPYNDKFYFQSGTRMYILSGSTLTPDSTTTFHDFGRNPNWMSSDANNGLMFLVNEEKTIAIYDVDNDYNEEYTNYCYAVDTNKMRPVVYPSGSHGVGDSSLYLTGYSVPYFIYHEGTNWFTEAIADITDSLHYTLDTETGRLWCMGKTKIKQDVWDAENNKFNPVRQDTWIDIAGTKCIINPGDSDPAFIVYAAGYLYYFNSKGHMVIINPDDPKNDSRVIQLSADKGDTFLGKPGNAIYSTTENRIFVVYNTSTSYKNNVMLIIKPMDSNGAINIEQFEIPRLSSTTNYYIKDISIGNNPSGILNIIGTYDKNQGAGTISYVPFLRYY